MVRLTRFMAQIELTRGLTATVDDIDADWAAQWVWRAWQGQSTNYAQRDEGSTTLQMHRELAKRLGWHVDGFKIDHIDGDGLNNRRANLRIATGSQNQANYQHKPGACTSAFRRVAWCGRKRKWQARVNRPKQSQDVKRGQSLHVGWFDDETEAALFADIMARELHGTFASANFPSVLAALPPLANITDQQLLEALESARKQTDR